MNKKDLVAAIAASGNTTQREVSNIVDSVFETITKAVSNGTEVSIAGFGKFTSALQKGRSGIVPGTTKTYTTQDKMIPKFKAAQALKDSVASGR